MHTILCILIEISRNISENKDGKKSDGSYLSCVKNGEFYFNSKYLFLLWISINIHYGNYPIGSVRGLLAPQKISILPRTRGFPLHKRCSTCAEKGLLCRSLRFSSFFLSSQLKIWSNYINFRWTDQRGFWLDSWYVI